MDDSTIRDIRDPMNWSGIFQFYRRLHWILAVFSIF